MIGTVAVPAVDAFGLTDRGRVREGNEDHFLIAHVSKSVEVQQTSLPSSAVAHEFAAGAGYLLAVADGVGGRPEGDLASERTLSAMLSYVGKAASCFQSLDTSEEHALLEKLEAVVHGVHEGLVDEYGGVTSKLPATTLTLVLLVWPRAYLVQVGDSRAYVRRGGRLQRLTRDQTIGEMMTALGAWTDEQARARSTAETLASAIGGTELEPVVGLIDLSPGDSLLLCTDGLTKHVSDEEIGGLLALAESAEVTGRKLVRDALAGGGTDNVTVVVVRTTPGAG
jgi:serine/threonine protein phosphatase PrpC